jgi:pimeloyl-ACP methyl ester carboxylesterase
MSIPSVSRRAAFSRLGLAAGALAGLWRGTSDAARAVEVTPEVMPVDARSLPPSLSGAEAPGAVPGTFPDGSCGAPAAPGAPRVRRGYANGLFGQVHYRLVDAASRQRPLLLMHPSPLSSEVFELFLPEIGRDRIALAPDTPGYGLSDPPGAPPAIADYARAMLALTRSFGWGEFDVLGYHTGSNTALEMAHQEPDRIRHVLLIGASLWNAEELAAMRRQLSPRPVGDRPAILAHRWPVFRQQAWRMICGDARALNILLESHRNADRSQWGFQASLDFPLEERLRACRPPLLVFAPEDDLWDYTRRAEGMVRNGRVQELPGWTHGFLDLKAAEVAGMVRSFTAAA